ncbi:MAG: hypothetical protein H6Q67_125 [Firmicutes bacterium]|nr:hypothetical protein [Bacillota bacterium]
MTNSSRIERKRKEAQVSYAKWCQIFFCSILGTSLAVVFHYGNSLGIVVGGSILFFGVLLVNPGNIRIYIPGLKSGGFPACFFRVLIYLFVTLSFIGIVGSQP